MSFFLDTTKDVLDFLKTLGTWIAGGLVAVGTGVTAVFTLLRKRNQSLEEETNRLRIENEELKERVLKLENETKKDSDDEKLKETETTD